MDTGIFPAPDMKESQVQYPQVSSNGASSAPQDTGIYPAPVSPARTVLCMPSFLDIVDANMCGEGPDDWEIPSKDASSASR